MIFKVSSIFPKDRSDFCGQNYRFVVFLLCSFLAQNFFRDTVLKYSKRPYLPILDCPTWKFGYWTDSINRCTGQGLAQHSSRNSLNSPSKISPHYLARFTVATYLWFGPEILDSVKKAKNLLFSHALLESWSQNN